MKRSHAILALLVVGVLLTAGVAAYAAPPVADNTARAAAPIAQEEAPAYLTLDLKAGFPLDPFLVSVNGGGPVDASTVDPACTGFINEAATLSVDWSGKTDLFRLFYYSDHDPMLMVQLPNGEYLCNDNANRLLLDPLITLKNPAEGNYRVWVGAADEGQLIPGVLVITAHDDVTPGNFALGGLIKRGAVADTLEEPVASDERKAAAAKLLAGVAALKAAARDTGRLETFSQDVTVTGAMEAHELPIGEAFCNGYINEQPDLVFTAPEGEKALLVYFEGNSDSTLVVAQPDGTFLCNDDSLRGENENPLLLLRQPQAGQYSVWVGRVAEEAELAGKLTVTKLAKQPAKLAPKPVPTPAK